MPARRTNPVHIALVGTGGMAHAHAQGYQKIRGVKLVACYDIDPQRAKEFAAKYKIPTTYDNLDALLKHPGLQGVSSVTPDAVHAEVAIKVAKAGLHILSEKPLASTFEEAKAMLRAVRRAGVVNMVNFSYRNSFGLQAAAARIARGDLGRIMHVEASYLQSWLAQPAWGDWHSEPAWQWRLSTRHGSQGTLGDIGCHLYDATCFLAGPIKTLSCQLKTFPKGVKGNRIGPYRLDANDSFVAHAEFKGGAIGVVHASRWATGHHNDLRFRIFGEEGAIEVDLARDPEAYRLCRGKKNLEKPEWCTHRARRTPNMYQRFIKAIRSGEADSSDFENGLQVQAYLHYSQQSDQQQQQSVKIK